ncbi:MAG: M28 family peptidase, partial [Bacteroidales bacterium]|nr:M28 family peptidase [Bacteroidales bacterium]
MNKSILFCSLVLCQSTLLISQCLAQKNGLKQIDIADLVTHVSYIASDELEGRKTGEPGLDLAAEYLAAQARELGLKAVDENGDYFQEYTLVTKKMDQKNSSITIRHGDEPKTRLRSPFYVLNPDSDKLELSGEAVFAGYGIYSEDDGYNDFEGVDLAGKIVLVMNRGPLDESGDHNLLRERNWKDRRSYQYKLPGLAMRMPKAVLIVMDPKSGHRSLMESSARMARYLSSSRYVKEMGKDRNNSMPDIATKVLFIHREVAEEILRSSVKSLAGLQKSIDQKRQPVSFELSGTWVDIKAAYTRVEKPVPNVVGLIEGNDPNLKKEVVVYTAHFDHLGINANGDVDNGADDNASGVAGVLELAEAFAARRSEMKRSMLFCCF